MKKELVAAVVLAAAFVGYGDVTLENRRARLVIGDDATAKSLVLKATGEELLDAHEGIPMFTVTQERPYHNEIKLTWPNKRTAYPANRLRQEGDRLIVGFRIQTYEAEVAVSVTDDYFLFRFAGFRVKPEDFGSLNIDTPPAVAFRLLQLPVKSRRWFGDWLNVSWDDTAVVSVMGADIRALVDHEDRYGFRLLTAELDARVGFEDVTAAIVVGAGREDFLDATDALERDRGLPRGVRSRRGNWLNKSIYWAGDITPETVDEHLDLAKRGGFPLMLLYYTCVTVKNWEFRKEYPNGLADLKAMLDKIKAAGITPGFHVLQTHIGMSGKWVTPVADPRLGIIRRFTLREALPEGTNDCELAVYENPLGTVKHPKNRVLNFGGELVTYESYTTEEPYRFLGVKRGVRGTTVKAHPAGEVGGLLDISEYGGNSCYPAQDNDLQDEIAERIAHMYSAGFEFIYFDGSEGVPPPCNYHVANSQYRVWKRFDREPLFGEAAAKVHFDWHMLAGANAFDYFEPEIFKAKIVEHPLAEAPLMRQDMTRVNFGWWAVWDPGDTLRQRPNKGKTTIGTQPDMWEYGTSKAAAWDCPMTIQMRRDRLKKHPRLDDLLETVRRWEDVRARNLLTAEQKELLKDASREYHLLPDGKGGYELVEWTQLEVAGGKWTPVRAFVHEKGGRRVVTYWHVSGAGELVLPDGTVLVAAGLREWTTDLPLDAVRTAFKEATIR